MIISLNNNIICLYQKKYSKERKFGKEFTKSKDQYSIPGSQISGKDGINTINYNEKAFETLAPNTPEEVKNA